MRRATDYSYIVRFALVVVTTGILKIPFILGIPVK